MGSGGWLGGMSPPEPPEKVQDSPKWLLQHVQTEIFMNSPMVPGNGTDSTLSSTHTVHGTDGGSVVRTDDGSVVRPYGRWYYPSRFTVTVGIPVHGATSGKSRLTAHGHGSSCSCTNIPIKLLYPGRRSPGEEFRGWAARVARRPPGSFVLRMPGALTSPD